MSKIPVCVALLYDTDAQKNPKETFFTIQVEGRKKDNWKERDIVYMEKDPKAQTINVLSQKKTKKWC